MHKWSFINQENPKHKPNAADSTYSKIKIIVTWLFKGLLELRQKKKKKKKKKKKTEGFIQKGEAKNKLM